MTAAPAHAAEPLRGDLRTASLLGTHGGGGSVTAATVAAAVAGETHTVQPGDTVSAIAARHGLRTVDVLAINGLDWSSVIVPGQVLILAAVAADAAPQAPAPPAPPASGASSYAVQGGDTISAIARLHGLSIQDLFAANGLDWSSTIYPGQTLAIPGGASAAPAEPATPAEPAAPAEAATPDAAAPELPTALAPSTASHVVAAGDTITAIAQQHSVTTQALLDANGLSRASIIYPGQAIAIPAAASVVLVSNNAPVESAPTTELDAEQVANAQIVIGVGRELGVPDRGIAIALGTAMQESWLRNLDWGDRDSLGLFQQRPSEGWGTEAEVSDPVRATRAFYGGPSDPNGQTTQGLVDFAGWESHSFADAAQAVQISAHPDRYAQWEQPAYAWLALYG